MDVDFDVSEQLENLGEIISLPFHIQIDCSLIIEDSLYGEKRYVWPQRCLGFNSQKVLNQSSDFKNLIEEVKKLGNGFLSKVYDQFVS